LGIATILRLLALVGFLGANLFAPDGDFYIVLVVALSVACLDTQAAISVRNIIVVYYFLVLGVGPYVVGVSDFGRVHRFAAMLLAAFLVGGLVRRALKHRAPRVVAGDSPSSVEMAVVGRRASILLKIGIAFQSLLIGMAILQYGVVGFFSGASLAGNISAFAEAGGLTNSQILNAGGFVFTASLVAAYIQLNEPQKRYHWPLLLVLLIGLPLVGFERADLVKNILVLLFLYRYAFQGKSKRIATHTVVLVGALAVALAAALGIGLLRSGNISAEQNRPGRLQTLLREELTPVHAVDYALAPGAPRFGGSGLYEPLVERFIPRRLYPDKAPNTTALYMDLTSPGALEAGYALAITGVGTILLNYGVWGAGLAALLVGFLVGSGRLPKSARIGYSVVLLFTLYDLVRTDLVFSLSQLLVTLIGYWLILALYRRGAARWQQYRLSREASVEGLAEGQKSEV
jgi:hypothetical protein